MSSFTDDLEKSGTFDVGSFNEFDDDVFGSDRDIHQPNQEEEDFNPIGLDEKQKRQNDTTSLTSSSTPNRSSNLITLDFFNNSWNTRDSGFSQSNLCFSSDEDEVINLPRSKVDQEASSPITIPITPKTYPHHRIRAAIKREEAECNILSKLILNDGCKEDIKEMSDNDDEDITIVPEPRGRAKSCPGNMKKPKFHCQIFSTANDISPAFNHSRNWSTPVTTPEGNPIFTAPVKPVKSSKERLLNVATQSDDSGKSGRNGRRVYITVFPDLVPETDHAIECAADPIPGNSNMNNKNTEPPSPFPLRPAWRRPRALSVDVTLEEVGHELRRMGDNFKNVYSTSVPENTSPPEETRGGFIKNLRNSFRRRFHKND